MSRRLPTRSKRVFLGGIACFLAIALLPNVATADGEPAAGEPQPGAYPVSGFLLTPAGGANPYLCKGRTDKPHMSSHSPGYVNVEGATYNCDSTQPLLGVRVYLYRRRGVFPIYWWELVATSTSPTCINCRSRTRNAAWQCPPGTSQVFYAKTDSWMTGRDSVSYSRWTEYPAVTIAC